MATKILNSKVSWKITIFALIGILLTLSAAYWQYNRALFKEKQLSDYRERILMSPLDASGLIEAPDSQIHFRRVSLTGEYIHNATVLLDNNVRDGIVGYEVVTPFLMNSGHVILVNRGWTKKPARRGVAPNIAEPKGNLLVGIVGKLNKRRLKLSSKLTEGNVWQNLPPSRYKEKFNLDVEKFMILQVEYQGDNLLREWGPPRVKIDTHLAYAGQWLLFSVLIVFLYIYYGFYKKKNG